MALVETYQFLVLSSYSQVSHLTCFIYLYVFLSNAAYTYMKGQIRPTRGVYRKSCPENMQQVCRKTPLPKCDFNNIALQIY